MITIVLGRNLVLPTTTETVYHRGRTYLYSVLRSRSNSHSKTSCRPISSSPFLNNNNNVHFVQSTQSRIRYHDGAFCFMPYQLTTRSLSSFVSKTFEQNRISSLQNRKQHSKHPQYPSKIGRKSHRDRKIKNRRSTNPFLPPLSALSPETNGGDETNPLNSMKDTKTSSSSSSQSSSSFVSFFDSVDARMKELQEQKERQNQEHSLITIPFLPTESDSNNEFSSWLPSNNDNNQNNTNINKNNDPLLDMMNEKIYNNTNPNAFNEVLFQSYKTSMEDIFKSPRFASKKKDKPEDIEVAIQYLLKNEPIVDIHLPTLDTSLTTSSSTPKQIKQTFEIELNQQCERFLQQTNFTSKQYQLALRGLSVLGDICAKWAMAAPLHIAWEKIKEAGMKPRDQSMSTYLYTVGVGAGVDVTTSNRKGTIPDTLTNNTTNSSLPFSVSSSSSMDRSSFMTDTVSQTEMFDVAEEIATFHDILYEPTEKTISLRIKRMVVKGDFAGAEALLERREEILAQTNKAKDKISSEDDTLKLRTYFPILKGYCETGDCSSALRLFQRMRESQGVQLEAENHVLLISTIAEYGYFKRDSKPVDGAVENLGYAVGSGPEFFDELVQEMADDVLEITSASARRFLNAFASAHTINNSDINVCCDSIHVPPSTSDQDEEEEVDFLLKSLPSLKDMSLCNETASKGELVVSRIAIDNTTAICPRTHAQLRLIMLEEGQKKEFRDALLRLSSEQFLSYKTSSKLEKYKFKESDDYAIIELNKFSDWLEVREGEPFTAIVDGANVAYYGQNFEEGKFNYHQIKFLVDALESKDENVLVILPRKYTTKYFYCSNGSSLKKVTLSKAELEILNGLNNTGKLYRVPARCLDDYYWMLASVSKQANSRKGRDLTIPPNDDSNQKWPGTRPMLLSNDQMRDHKLELLAPRLFRRWTSSHIVNYNFTAFVDGECVDNEIGFSAPDFFSREIQGNPSEDDGGTAWHFPVSDWEENERFCIRIPH